MKKSWRFTPKQVRKDWTPYNNNWKAAFDFHAAKDLKRLKHRNQKQLWLQLHNWIEEAIYADKIYDKTTFNFW